MKVGQDIQMWVSNIHCSTNTYIGLALCRSMLSHSTYGTAHQPAAHEYTSLLYMLQVLQMLQEYFRQQQEHSEAMEQLLSLADKLSLSTTTEEVSSLLHCL